MTPGLADASFSCATRISIVVLQAAFAAKVRRPRAWSAALGTGCAHVCGVYPLRIDWVEQNPHVLKYSEPLNDL
jgi:hypothetical protein